LRQVLATESRQHSAFLWNALAEDPRLAEHQAYFQMKRAASFALLCMNYLIAGEPRTAWQTLVSTGQSGKFSPKNGLAYLSCLWELQRWRG
jgi:hypothetical protein